MNANETIAEVLRKAQEAVDAAGIEDPTLKQIAFKEAIALAASEAGLEGRSSEEPSGESKPQRQGGAPSKLSSIAVRLGISEEEADRIFHVEDDDLELTVPVSALSPAKKTGTHEVAILIAAGRQAAGIDDRETDAEHVRSAASHYKKLDPPNFSHAIKDLSGVLTVRERGRKKYLKMTQPGWEEAATLVGRILGKSE